MFNSELNDRSTNKLIRHCENKSVLIVGNSLSLFGKEYGDLIDSYDVVVRMGKAFPYPEFKQFMGSKTNCWIFSTFRSETYKLFKSCRFKVFNLSQINVYDKAKKDLVLNKCFFQNNFQIYKDYFLMGDINQTLDLMSLVNSKNRVSQGALTISYFVNKIKSYKNLDIIGFDFFESTISYERKNQKHTINSFHIPLLPDLNNPHYDNKTEETNDEKKYILNLEKENKIFIHKMDSQPKEETLNLLFSKFRPDGKIV